MKGFLTRMILNITIFLLYALCTNKYNLENCLESLNSLKCDYVYKDGSYFGLANEQEFLENSKLKKQLVLEVNKIDSSYEGITHIKVTDKIAKRYEVPRYIMSDEFRDSLEMKINPNFTSIFKKDKDFLEIKDQKNDELLFTLFKNDLEFLDDFISFDYGFPSNDIFGYGERSHDFKLEKGIYTIWPNDTGAGSIEDDRLGGKNLYGSQPFLLVRNPNSKSQKNSYIGVLFLNSNAQDLEIYDEGLVKQITIGGIIEIFAWARENPIQTIQVLHHIVGKPALPTYWSLGWHQCRWGYTSTQHLENVVSNYLKHEIPLDTIWSDIDYMHKYEDFTIDSKNFSELPNFVERIKIENGIHYVPILDIGIPNNPDNYYYKLGKELNAFIKSNYTSQPLINEVWPGVCVFPDFTNYFNATLLWETGLNDLKIQLDYDGLWLDMNEPGVFQEGEIREPNNENDKDKNIYYNLTYIPGRDRIGLENHTLSVNALLNEGEPFNTVYNLKPINTWLQNKISNQYLTRIDKRPFILSRSNYLGMGRYSNHWLGDNFSTYDSMKKSISGIFNYQMFGFNLVGADICGFLYDTTDELCARWTTLGAFYPFSRNHNNFTAIDQEPWALGELTLNSAKRAINLRYSLLRYLYTQHYLSSLNGGVVFQPLFFQFSEIPDLIENTKALNEQIMVGPSLLLAPALEETTNDYEVVFPYSNWNKFPSGQRLIDVSNFSSKTGTKKLNVSGNYDEINLFLRGGHIIPYQQLNYSKIKISSSRDLKKIPLTLIISLDENDYASGEIIWDNDSSIPEKIYKFKEYLHVRVEFKGLATGIKFETLNEFNYRESDATIDQIVIYLHENNKLHNEIKKLIIRNLFKGRENILKLEPHKITVALQKPLRIFKNFNLYF